MTSTCLFSSPLSFWWFICSLFLLLSYFLFLHISFSPPFLSSCFLLFPYIFPSSLYFPFTKFPVFNFFPFPFLLSFLHFSFFLSLVSSYLLHFIFFSFSVLPDLFFSRLFSLHLAYKMLRGTLILSCH